MTAKIVVVSPKCSKESARRLADLLGAAYVPAGILNDFTNFDLVVNYGSSNHILYHKIINKPHAVKMCVNKISTLKRVVNGVEWTKDPKEALVWLKEDGAVVCREFEEGSRGEGCNIAFNKEGFDTSPAKFWTRYFEHEHEVRINVYKGKILSVYKKVEEEGFFDFVHMEINGEHKQVDEMIQSITANIGIDLYGMDVLVNKKGIAKLLEINSGASLMEHTEPKLIETITKEIENYA